MKRLEGKTAIITGAGSGIGRAGAMLFAEHGAAVVLVDLSPDVGATAEAIRAAGGAAIALQSDAANDDAVAEAVQTAVEQYGTLDIYYANAGIIGERKPFDDLTAGDWSEVLRVNLSSAFLAIQHATRVMVPARRGSILCTTSVAGLRGGGGPAPYSASKAAIINLVQTSAQQFGPSGIRVNAICPGMIDQTGMGQPTFEMARRYGVEREMTQMIALRRGGLPAEVAQAALFLASDESSYVTGHVLEVDGGMSASLPTVPVGSLNVRRQG
ncbi:MAG TPA: SDR family NAD(P)-dependent oxidoreductase [Thermoanaerobaculia bacterium]